MSTSSHGANENLGQGAAPVGRNRLASATSPYLLQHKDNPVNWYPWGPEALKAARSEDKPIFLSVGYSACHWCHVMEEESFEDPNTAEVMNKYFVSIKVDREERPDLDDIYMTAVQMLTGSGGWPMSVWLTPDLKPFYGGTYFPKERRYGRPSFTEVLTSLGEAWRTDRASLLARADQVHESVVGSMSGHRAPAVSGDITPGLITKALEEMTGNFDHVYGGFGRAPKFPPSRGLALMLARYRQNKDENLIRMATLTFEKMAYGGMYDQIGGGFHRYSTDPMWLVPHFEKMLYDNALLADAYLDALQVRPADLYRRIPREIFEYVLREMTDPDGAFYSSLDADSDGAEGKFYVWRPEEVTGVVGQSEGALINEYYGITAKGNFEGGASIPHVEVPPEQFAERKRIAPADLMRRLDAARAKLLAKRETRVRPPRDDKVLTAWNGLMIAALARGGTLLETPRYTQAAAKAADFILRNARGEEGLLKASFRAGRTSGESFLNDQAFFIRGLLALHEATRDGRWLAEARALMKAADSAFLDPTDGGYFFSRPGRPDLIVRAKSPSDGALPSGNSVMASSLLALHRLTGDSAYRLSAEKILSTYSGAMSSMPGGFHNMLSAVDEYLATGAGAAPGPIVTVTVDGPAGPVAPGGAVDVAIRLDIRQGWHINSAKPTLDYLIPTSATVQAGGAAALASVEYPEGKLVTLGFARKAISVYEGGNVIRIRLQVDRGAAAGSIALQGNVIYQACNDKECLPPAETPIEIPLKIAAKG
jgi:hypothetical protein